MRLFDHILKILGRLRLWQQFILLGLFVVTVPIISTSLKFLHDGQVILTEHEIIDLSDEGNLRVTDIREDFEFLSRDVSREARRVSQELSRIGKGTAAPLDSHKPVAEEAFTHFEKEWSESLPVTGQAPESVTQVRRRFCRGIFVSGVAFSVTSEGKVGSIHTTFQPPGQNRPCGFSEKSPERLAIDDLATRMIRDVPGPFSGVYAEPPVEGRSRCLMAVGWPARWVGGKPADILAVIVDFTRYFENRSRTSPRHRFLVAKSDGTLLVHPESLPAAPGANVRTVGAWEFPPHAWVTENEADADREKRMAKVLREGGIRLAGVPMKEMAYFYRKGSFGDDLRNLFPDATTTGVMQDLNAILTEETVKNPRFRFSELTPAVSYIELAHPDRSELLRISALVDQWWKKHQPRKKRVDWISPLSCQTFQGQLTYLRIDTSDDREEPLRLIVAASLEELHEDIDTRFQRIFLTWVLPAVLASILLTVVLVVVLTRSLQRLAKSAESLTDPKSLDSVEGVGCREVTQLAASLRHMATRLRDEAARYHSILRAAGEGIVVTSNEGMIEEANRAAARMFGYEKPEDLFGRLVSDLIADQLPNVPDVTKSGQLTVTAGMMTRGTPFGDAIRGRRRDGSEFWLEVTLRPVGLKGRSVVTFVFRDVSQRKQAEEQIRHMNEDLEARVNIRTAELAEANSKLEIALQQAESASRAKDTFVANMSHELRQPLHIIIGFTEALKEEATDVGREDLIPDLNKILSAAKHLLDLINDILDLAKISSGRMELSLVRFDVGKLVEDMRTLVGPLAEKNANTFIVDAPPDLGKMLSDERRVRQILINVLSNAFKFTAKGRVILRVRRLSSRGVEWMEFSVTDSGKGMTSEQVARLFQRFYQADASTTREQGGTGLGLAITQSFNELLGGRPIRVTSSPGNGSEFVIRLPIELHPPAYRDTTRPVLPLPPEANEESLFVDIPETVRTILIIDDDIAVHELMTRFLVREGFRVVATQRGSEGLRLARTIHPAVILLDVMMPGEDGWSILTQLKANTATCDIPVVMVTIVDDLGRGFTLGAADYLTKPIDWQRLSAIVKRYRSGDRNAPVLVIDDDPECREMIRRFLDRDGWNVNEAADGEAGLRSVAADPPSIVLLDLMMPGMDGFGFLDEMNRRFPGSRTPVIVLTAKELSNDDRDRLKGRVAETLEKGDMTRIDQVIDLIRRHVGSPKTKKLPGEPLA